MGFLSRLLPSGSAKGAHRHWSSWVVLGGRGVVVLHVQTEQSGLTAVQMNKSGLWPRTTWHKLIIIIKVCLRLRIYKLTLHFLGQHWRVSSVLALTLGPFGLPGSMAVPR